MQTVLTWAFSNVCDLSKNIRFSTSWYLTLAALDQDRPQLVYRYWSDVTYLHFNIPYYVAL
jgi:hypothetical protein